MLLLTFERLTNYYIIIIIIIIIIIMTNSDDIFPKCEFLYLMTGECPDEDERLARHDVEGAYCHLIHNCSSFYIIFFIVCVCGAIIFNIERY